jgi:hypothetical protein
VRRAELIETIRTQLASRRKPKSPAK